MNQLRTRAAMLWDIDVDAVDWRDDHAHPAGSNAGKFEPLSLAELASKAALTGGRVPMSPPKVLAALAARKAPGPSVVSHDTRRAHAPVSYRVGIDELAG
ncbi:MAG: hypothetical protein OXI90_01780 [Gammaproteobacteria bacterium]|nr:hypothetical protein [Gammaproteobacteria bacterium]